MSRRLLFLLAGALLTWVPWTALAAGEDGTCSAEDAAEGGCRMADQLAEQLESELDGVAKDIQQMCPLYESRMTPVVLWLLGILKRSTGTMSMLSLWPSGVHPETFADEYTASVMTIIGRVLLGMYKTRDKSYVNMPTEMLSADDILKVENIHAPHYDVDGNPNFYWFEAAVPKFALRRLYVPLMTCFYSALRKLNVENHSLSGSFDDALNDPKHNTWEAVLSEGQSMRDWVMSFYDIAHTWDGTPLWPKQMTDFSVYFKKDEWEDQLEYAIAFHLIGAHRLESGQWSFDVPGQGSVTLPFRIALNMLSGFKVRENFGKYGVDLYFTEDGLPALLETPQGDIVVRGDKEWQYWKFVWRSTLVTGVTLTDHLHFTHFRTGNLMARAVRVALEGSNPLRRVFSIFTFGTIFVNVQAVHVLCGPNHLLHRATPFSDFVKLSHKVPEILQDITEATPIRAITEDAEFEKLHPKLKQLPFYADGRLLFAAIQKFVDEMYEQLPLCENGKLREDFHRLKEQFLNETLEANYQIDERIQKYTREDNCDDGKFLPIMKHRLAVNIFVVTGFHRHVGFVGDYYADPGLATMSWKSGEAFGRPRQHMIMSVVNVFTSMRQPLLKEDYTHLFKGLENEEGLTKAWRNFQANLQEVEEEIDRRNEKREIKNINMSPKVVESAVSK